MAFNEVRQNFASRPLFSGDLGRDLDELERRAGSSSVANNANNPASSSLQRNYNQHNHNNNSRSNSSFNNNNNNNNNNMMSPGASSYYNNNNNNNNNNNSARTPLADHHHLGSSSNNARGGGGGGNTPGSYNAAGSTRGHPQGGGPQVSFISSPSAPIPYGHNNNNTSGATTNNTSSFMTVSGHNNNNNNNNNYGSDFSPASQQQQQHNVRGPSNSGAWSLLPPQIPRPLGLQRFLDEQFAPPPMMQHQGGGSRNAQQGVDGNNANQQQQQYNNNNKPESIGRSSGATYNRSNPTTPTPSAQKHNNKSAPKSSRRARTPAGQYQGDYGAGRGPYAMMNSTDEEEFGDVDDFDPIATGARHRREQIENEINIYSSTQGVGEFAQSLGIGTAEAVAARMAAEVARQAAQKPNVTADDLQSNHSNSTKDAAATTKTGGPRASEVAIMRRRMERIDDGLARAAMRQQLAQERLKNVVASGLVAEGGSQTDMNMAPLDTGAKPRSNLLVDPSALDPASVGGSAAAAAQQQQQLAAAGAGGGDQTEQDLEAVAKMNMMKKSGLLLMPAVPYEHFKYVAPEVSSSMMSKREQEEKSRKNPGQAKAEAKDALKDRLDQLELAHEELLIRNRIVPTQPDQYGSNRPHKDQNVDPTSVLASIDPRDQLAASPENSRAPKPDTIDKTIDHAASAYRMQHQKIAAPVGGYGSVMDPRSQTTQETAAEEQRRWALAKARNEAEGMSFTSTGTGGPLGASATAQLRNQQDDTGLMANASLRTLPSGNQRDAYDARKKWSGVSFENPGSNKFQGTHMEAISKESRDLYGFDATQ